MPNGNLQAIKDPKISEEAESLRRGYEEKRGEHRFDNMDEVNRSYAAFLRTQTVGASRAKWAAIRSEIPDGYGLQLPSPGRTTTVDNFAQAIHDRYKIPHTDVQQEKVWAFAEEAVSRLGLAGKSASEVENAVQQIATEQERMPTVEGSMRKALDRVMEARAIEKQTPEMREQTMVAAAEVLRHSMAGTDAKVAITYRLLVDSLSERALIEAAIALKMEPEMVITHLNELAKNHEHSVRGESLDNVLRAREYAVRQAKTEMESAGIRPATAEVLGSLANREWLADRQKFINEINEVREDVRRMAKVQPVGKFVSAEDAMLAKIEQEVRAGNRNIDLSTTYKTGNADAAQIRHDKAFRNLADVIPDLEQQGHTVHKGVVGTRHSKDVSGKQQWQVAI